MFRDDNPFRGSSFLEDFHGQSHADSGFGTLNVTPELGYQPGPGFPVDRGCARPGTTLGRGDLSPGLPYFNR
tara:strand:- start:31 stop:246 length:216 start_codon:yes stop_codon:yes gene_type:complete